MNSIEMQRIYFDDIHMTFGYNDTTACLYDDKWYTGIIMDTCNENNDVKVKFMRCNRLCLSWYEHDSNYGKSLFDSISTYLMYCCCTTFAQESWNYNTNRNNM